MRNVFLGIVFCSLIAVSSGTVYSNEAGPAGLEEAVPKAQVIALVQCTQGTIADEAHAKERTQASSFEVINQYKGEALSNFVLRQQPAETLHFKRGERAFLFLTQDASGALHVMPGNSIYEITHDPSTGAAIVEYNGRGIGLEQFAAMIANLAGATNG